MGQIEIPDFDDLMSLVERIGELSERRDSLELEISIQEALAHKTCATNEEYYTAGKPPAVTYVNATYKVTGLNGEILPLRRELAAVSARLEVARKTYDVLKSKIDVWRTQQATVRSLA